MTYASSPKQSFNVLIAGGGVAALEAALALREFGGDRISTTMIAPTPEFVYRPMSVQEPFGYAGAERYLLADIAQDIGVNLRADSFQELDASARVVHTAAGDEIPYDALLLALGARMHPRFKHAITVDDRRLDEVMHGLIQDVEGGYVRRLAFIVPGRMGWPLPVYELALMTAARAYEMNIELSISLATPEVAPLASFGLGVSAAVAQLLAENGILTIPSAHCEVPGPGRVEFQPGLRELHVDRIVAMPELFGPSVPGVPLGPTGGFIAIDPQCRVRGLEGVYAAGDATDFPVKHGGIAALQADVAAQSIAALAGLADEPSSFRPVVHGMLLTGGRPRYLTAQITGGHGSSSEITDYPTWSPATKIVAKYLAPYLEAHSPLMAGIR